MHFYIGSRFANIEQVRALRNHLINDGHTYTYDWTRNDRATTIEDLRAIGTSEFEAIKASDFVVILLPAGQSSHIELGIALGADVPLFIYDPANRFDDFETTSTFYHLPHVIQLTGPLKDVPQAITAHFADTTR
ncbi:group-specific protein [Exiguobacterium mexicanum]|uniref:Group-specific protein n=1 Tax=Exiguobacterium mexicanum TaxID=340146 RepID=A0ABT7ML40_9BACL|nr:MULTISPECIES: group-specific protein [Exiguobacterium]MDL5376133.1 group-specific protein [Exiguobacterium mexicanum]